MATKRKKKLQTKSLKTRERSVLPSGRRTSRLPKTLRIQGIEIPVVLSECPDKDALGMFVNFPKPVIYVNPDQPVAEQLGGTDRQPPADRLLQIGLAVIEGQLQFAEAEHGNRRKASQFSNPAPAPFPFRSPSAHPRSRRRCQGGEIRNGSSPWASATVRSARAWRSSA